MRVLLLMFVMAACGGGGGDAGGGSGSGPGGGEKLTSLDPAKKMGDLSKEQKKQLCEDFKAFQKKTKPSEAETLKMACSVKGMFQTVQASEAKDDAALRAECKKTTDDCIAKKEVPPEKELDCSSEEFLGQMSECKDVTVGEVGDCVRDMAGVMKRVAAEDFCAGIKVGDRSSVDKVFEKMKSTKCEAVETKCRGSAGPGPNGPAAIVDPALEKEAITKVEEFKTKMCACKDKACAESVSAAMTAWGEDMARKTQGAGPSAEGTKKMTDIVTEYTACMTKLLAGEGSGSAAGSGSAKASGSGAAAGSGSAKK